MEKAKIIASFQKVIASKNEIMTDSRPTRILVTQYLRTDGDSGPS